MILKWQKCHFKTLPFQNDIDLVQSFSSEFHIDFGQSFFLFILKSDHLVLSVTKDLRKQITKGMCSAEPIKVI